MDRKMGMERGQAENLVSQAKQKLKYDLIEGKVGLDIQLLGKELIKY